MIKKYFTALLTVLSLSLMGQNEINHQLSIELDPAPYILGGYSVSFKYSPKKTPKIAYMGSVYQSDFPDGMMKKTNRDNGWTNLKIEASYAVFAELYLNEERKGFYFGPSVFWYNKSVEFDALNERTKFETIYPNVRIGYVWYPFNRLDLYLNPWLNLGSEINLDDKNNMNGIEFKPNNINYIIALHIGYSFRL